MKLVCLKCTASKRRCSIRDLLRDRKLSRQRTVEDAVTDTMVPQQEHANKSGAGVELTMIVERILAIEQEVDELHQRTNEILGEIFERLGAIEQHVGMEISLGDVGTDGMEQYVAGGVIGREESDFEDADIAAWDEYAAERVAGRGDNPYEGSGVNGFDWHGAKRAAGRGDNPYGEPEEFDGTDESEIGGGDENPYEDKDIEGSAEY